ncbi:secreted RxLR effector protein 161-like [Impatiens glandulifera]|uniref:secreted RxLR effector protein 161-like n=1 Tax=Impatiens glandulifera TaxID=253017 RepID=UPI001FB07A99|nr:secreted RxLR effector protein 161-like [Impatiens glandulifera]
MEDCKSMSTHLCHKEKLSKNDETNKVDEALYRRLVGCLIYLTETRPDILHVVSLLSFTNCATETHFRAAKRVLRYVKGTPDFGIKFSTGLKCSLQGYSDSDWAGSIDDMRTEAEFIVAIVAANQALWLRKMLIDLNLRQEDYTEVFIDNQAAIFISNNPFHIKLFFLREVQKEGSVNRHIHQGLTEEQVQVPKGETWHLQQLKQGGVLKFALILLFFLIFSKSVLVSGLVGGF